MIRLNPFESKNIYKNNWYLRFSGLYTLCERIKHKKDILIIRVLGNDLQGIHGHQQTYENLKFTLENEKLDIGQKIDKVFVLNKIVDTKLKQRLIQLLDKYQIQYIDFPFDYSEYKKATTVRLNLTTNDFRELFDKNLSDNEKHNKIILQE